MASGKGPGARDPAKDWEKAFSSSPAGQQAGWGDQGDVTSVPGEWDQGKGEVKPGSSPRSSRKADVRKRPFKPEKTEFPGLMGLRAHYPWMRL